MRRTPEKDILVVDGCPEALKGGMSLLADADEYRIRFARDGSEAIRLARRTPPDLVLLDAGLPGEDARAVCGQLKGEPLSLSAPVIFMIAINGAPLDVSRIFQAGAADYIIKPFIAQELLARVRAHLCMDEGLVEEIERHRVLESAVFNGVFIHEKGIILEVNDTLAQMLDYPPDQIVGRHLTAFIPSAWQLLVKKALANPNQDSVHCIEVQRRDGTALPVEARARNIQYRGRPARVNVLRDLSSQKRLENENIALRASLDDRDHLGGLVGRSLAMRQVYNRIIQAAAVHDTVLIQGETGTGKELAARTIFDLSPRARRPFVVVNCGAIQEPLFEAMFFGRRRGAFTGADTDGPGFLEYADGGFLFLDEVGELTPTMQAKLLRALQSGEYTPVGSCQAQTADVRIISATNRNLAELVKTGRMRPDFFQRIHVIPIEMPPLRNHKEDIGLLTAHFMRRRSESGADFRPIPEHLMDRLMAHDWPGNVREMFNELIRFQATGEVEPMAEAPDEMLFPELSEIPEGRTYAELMEAFERKVLAAALSRCEGNRSRAVDVFKIPRKTLQRKIKKYNL